METNDFLSTENYMLRREIERLKDRIKIYEDVIFDSIDAKFTFEIDEENVSTEPHLIMHVNIPEINISTVYPLSKIKDIMLVSLRQDKTKTSF